MEISHLSRNNIRLLLEMKGKKVVTSRTQSTYGGLGFYGASKFLQKYGLISQNGTNKERQQMFMLTENGLKVATLIEKTSEILATLGGDQ